MTINPAEAAARYAHAGWPVFPLHDLIAGRCSCTAGPHCPHPGKHPRTRNGYHDATTHAERVARWWARWPAANIAIPTGHTGLVVVDLDGPGGLATWNQLAQQHGSGRDTATANTPHGVHRWYRTRTGIDVPRRIGALGPGVDLLGDGGYAIAPPSAIPCSRTDPHPEPCTGGYTWTWPRHRLAPLPAWIVRHAQRREQMTPPHVQQAMRDRPDGDRQGSRYGQAALAGEATRVAAAPKGSRSDTLNAAAFRLGRLAAAGHVCWEQIVQALENAAQRNGHIADDGYPAIRATISSGLNAGYHSPSPRRSHTRADRANQHGSDQQPRPGLAI